MIYEPCVMLKPEMIDIHPSARLDSFCKVEGGLGVTIGAYVHVASFVHLNIGGGKLTIGEHAGVSSGAKILSGSNTMDGVSMSATSPAEMQVIKRTHTIIEPYAFVGTNAVIMPGVRLGRGCVVGAGAVVTRDVAPGAIAVGVPARVVGIRAAVP